MFGITAMQAAEAASAKVSSSRRLEGNRTLLLLPDAKLALSGRILPDGSAQVINSLGRTNDTCWSSTSVHVV